MYGLYNDKVMLELVVQERYDKYFKSFHNSETMNAFTL